MISRARAETAAPILPALHPLWSFHLAPRPERLPRGPRRIRDGLWSAARYTFDDLGREIASMTHADGHSIVWPVNAIEDAVLIGPDGRIVDTQAGRREAHAFAFHWGAP